MKFKIVTSLAEETWRQFLAKNPDANVFHTPEFFKLFSQVKGHEPRLWAAVDDNGEIFALLTPVNVTLMDGMLSRLTTRAVVYGGVLYEHNAEGYTALEQLLQTYTAETKKQGILFTEFRNLADLTEVQPL
jgi:hypothetical protein